MVSGERALYRGVSVNARAVPHHLGFVNKLLDLTHQVGFSAMGKRMQVTDSAMANEDEASGCGDCLAGLRKAAGFSQVELAVALGTRKVERRA